MDKATLYKIAETVDCSFELGISSELNSFMEYEDLVKSYIIKFDNDIYEVEIWVKEYTKQNVRRIFSNLVLFIEYTSTYYIKEEHKDKTEFTLLSASDKRGFLCHVVFYKL